MMVSKTTHYFKFVLLSLLISAVSACGTSTKRAMPGNAEGVPVGPGAAQGPPVPPGPVYGPNPGTETAAAPSPIGVFPSIPNPDRVVLVFGPGLVHGYAYIGVLRALRELRIEVHGIYGTEMGALAGALYYTQPNPNRIDWALLRFTEKNLQTPRGNFNFRIKSPENELESKLKEVFGDRRLETLSGKLHVSLVDTKTKEFVEATMGDLWRILRGALAGANGFSAADLDGREVRASNRKISEDYRIARQREGYPILVVSVGDAPSDLFRKLVQEQNGLALHVPMGAISNTEMKQRNQAVFSGKNAVHQATTEILQLVGRKPEASE